MCVTACVRTLGANKNQKTQTSSYILFIAAPVVVACHKFAPKAAPYVTYCAAVLCTPKSSTSFAVAFAVPSAIALSTSSAAVAFAMCANLPGPVAWVVSVAAMIFVVYGTMRILKRDASRSRE